MKKIIALLIIILIFMCGFIFAYIKAPSYVTLVLEEAEYFFENGTYDINKIQGKEEQDIIDEYSKETHTLDNPYIEVAPFENELSAVVAFNDSKEVNKISYTAKGKTKGADLTFEKDYNKSGDIYIPIVGLYANDTTDIIGTVTYSDKTTKDFSLSIATEEVDIEEQDLKTKYDVKDQNGFNDILGNSLVFTSNYTGYDINGDIRIAINTSDYELANKTVNFEEFDTLEAVPMPAFGENDKIYQMDLMGYYNLDNYLEIPEEMTYHHDMTKDEDGNYYVLVRAELSFWENVMLVLNPMKTASEPEMSEVVKYDSNGKYVTQVSLGDIIDAPDVGKLKNSRSRDLHLNSIEYLDTQDLLLISSRTTSQIYFINPDTFEIQYVFGEPDMVSENLKDKQFKLLNQDKMLYPSGQHTAYQYHGVETNPNEVIISMYDNRSCLEGDSNLFYNGERTEETYSCVNSESRVLFYRVNFENKTIKLEKVINTSEKASFMGNVFEHDNYIAVGKEDIHIYDKEGNLIGESNFNGSEKYRINVLEDKEMKEMI